ncbi:hypothetical protein BK809_0000021 [Diplodia seriata]|uniref:Uncharacterized protein n=1 Tax=Diplodia seriata TaxID=420778 RepID=A0A1S8BQ51_9PEZI|nr:hypothetical protein BK809_0000021 [Diplodia seriata]
MSALVLIFYSYEGWENANYVGSLQRSTSMLKLTAILGCRRDPSTKTGRYEESKRRTKAWGLHSSIRRYCPLHVDNRRFGKGLTRVR